MRLALVAQDQQESLVDLLQELHAYYGDPPVPGREDFRAHLLDNLVAAGSPLRLVVAEDPDHGVVGLAALVLLYSVVEPGPDDRRQCQLKELFVRESHRAGGVGEALVRWSVRYALDHGCGRMDWSVREANRAGIAFYERLGAHHVTDRLSYRLSRTDMLRLVEPSPA